VAAPHIPAPATPPGTPPSGTYRPTSGSWQQPPATRPYTSPQPPAAAPPVPPGVPEPAAPVAVRRPGPPAKVAVPVLVVALLCIAFGIWALTVS
ncbi:serine/threonine protein kinase, partial [Streptomyces benahoarensis]